MHQKGPGPFEDDQELSESMRTSVNSDGMSLTDERKDAAVVNENK